MLPVALGHTPSGASVKQMIHFAQLIKSGHFRKYDYGRFRNDMRYGTTEPPDYNLLNVKMPVSLYYSENDWLLDVESVQKLSTLLPNVQDKYLIPLKQFNHLDFCWAVDGRKIVYGRLLENMQIAESNGNLFSWISGKQTVWADGGGGAFLYYFMTLVCYRCVFINILYLNLPK